MRYDLTFNKQLCSKELYREQDFSRAIQDHSGDLWLRTCELPRLFHSFLKELNSTLLLAKNDSGYVCHEYFLHEWCELFLRLAEGI